jgi:hypothetical protein
MAPVLNQEHGANAFDRGNNKDDCFVAPASFVVTADHNPGRDDGGPLVWRFCRLGSEVDSDYPKQTWRTPMHCNTTTVGRGDSGIEGLARKTSDQARCAVSSTGLLWR